MQDCRKEVREQNADLMAASALGLWYMEQDFGETAEVLFPCYGGSFSYIAATVTLSCVRDVQRAAPESLPVRLGVAQPKSHRCLKMPCFLRLPVHSRLEVVETSLTVCNGAAAVEYRVVCG